MLKPPDITCQHTKFHFHGAQHFVMLPGFPASDLYIPEKEGAARLYPTCERQRPSTPSVGGPAVLVRMMSLSGNN